MTTLNIATDPSLKVPNSAAAVQVPHQIVLLTNRNLKQQVARVYRNNNNKNINLILLAKNRSKKKEKIPFRNCAAAAAACTNQTTQPPINW